MEKIKIKIRESSNRMLLGGLLELFLKRMVLYIALNAIAKHHLVITFREEETKKAVKRSNFLYGDYRGFTIIV